jgi:hypothetical protein
MPEMEFRINGDGYLVTLASIYGRVAVLPEPQSLYRVHGNNHFASLERQARRERLTQMYRLRCKALARHLGMRETDPAPSTWLSNAPYQWENRVAAAKANLEKLVPPGTRFILVDQEGWAKHGSDGEVMPGRYAFPFLERDGYYDGLPDGSEVAIQNLEDLRSRGAAFIVFTWATRWWMETFNEFGAHIEKNYKLLTSDDLIAVFDLR